MILSGIWKGRGEEILNTKWDMERKRGGSAGYLAGYGEEEVSDTKWDMERRREGSTGS